MVPPPKKVKKLERSAVHEVADYGIFRVQRLVYPALPRDITVYDCPDWVNVIAETAAGEIVFCWQYRFGTDALSLEVPAGVIDPGEEPIVAAARELREETGYVAESIEFLCVVSPNPAFQGNRCFTYVARNARLAAETAFDDIEDIETALVPIAELPALLDSGQITHALVIGPLETYLRRAVRGRSSTTSASSTV